MWACVFSNSNFFDLEALTYYRINNNAHYICFWILAHLICKPDILIATRAETDATFKPDGSIDLNLLSTSCPHLDSAWHEALRVYNASTAVRKAVEPVIIGGKQIHVGDQIFGPARNFQFDGVTFGDDSASFNVERFLNHDGLHKSRNYVPFGGGHTYCPGRHFAQRETYMLVARALKRFEFEVANKIEEGIEDPVPPPVELKLPAPAAMRPEVDMFVNVRPRK